MTAINPLMVLDDSNFISTNLLLACFLLTCIKSIKKKQIVETGLETIWDFSFLVTYTTQK